MILSPQKDFILFKILNKRQVAERIIRVPFHSWVRQFTEMIRSEFAYVSTNIRDTSNTIRSCIGNNPINLNAAEGIITSGIAVGTGVTPVTISDYMIETIIAHGNAANQLYYLLLVMSAPLVLGSSCYMNISRNMVNNSGGTITVQEVGLLANYGGTYKFLIARDLTGGIDVEDGKTLSVQYTFQVTV